MKTPLVSVIIPVYNVENYLGKCFQSVVRQTYKNLEIILVDDGSTDASGKLCDQYALSDDRVIVIHQKNAGLSAARNAGLKVMKGDYLTFLDSDDAFGDNHYIEKLYEATLSTKSDLAICAIKEITNTKSLDYGAKQRQITMDQRTCLIKMLTEQGFNVSAYAKLYHQKLWQGIRFPVGKVHEDLGTTYRPIMKCEQAVYVPSVKYHYIRRNDSISSSSFNEQKLDVIELTDKMCDAIDKRYHDLQDLTNLRRIYARFSILCQIPRSSHHQLVQDLTQYIKKHKSYIIKNQYASLKDRVALGTFLISPLLFAFIWKIYNRHREVAL